MKKHLLFSLTAIFLAGAAFAQNDNQYLDAHDAKEKAYRESIAAKFKKWLPKGWVVESVAEGDLNGDGIPDVAVVASDRDINNTSDDDSYDVPLYSKIFVFMNEGNGYFLFLQNSDYVDGRTLGPRGRPEAFLEINKGVLTVFVGTPYPSWREKRLFRMEDNRLRLIGMESGIFHISHGVSENTSYNLLTGKCQEKVEFLATTESEKREIEKETGLKEKSVWKRIKGNKKIYFGEKDDSLECQ